MADSDRSPLQVVVADAIARSGKPRDSFDSALRKKLSTTGKPLWDIERGKVRKPSPRVLRAIEEVVGFKTDQLVDLVHPRDTVGTYAEPSDHQPTRSIDAGETAAIVRLDLSLPMGPGATVDDYVEEEPLEFDLGYLRSFTRTPPSRLRLARGVGDSMFPTLLSSDLVWIDSTQTHLNQSDRVWAVSINGAAAIKRLRPMKGQRVLIISDNPGIDNYEVDADEVMIGGRVIRFARDL